MLFVRISVGCRFPPCQQLDINSRHDWLQVNEVQSNQLYGQQGKNLEVPMVNQHESWLKKNHSQSPGLLLIGMLAIVQSNKDKDCRKEHKDVWWQHCPTHQQFAAPLSINYPKLSSLSFDSILCPCLSLSFSVPLPVQPSFCRIDLALVSNKEKVKFVLPRHTCWCFHNLGMYEVLLQQVQQHSKKYHAQSSGML